MRDKPFLIRDKPSLIRDKPSPIGDNRIEFHSQTRQRQPFAPFQFEDVSTFTETHSFYSAQGDRDCVGGGIAIFMRFQCVNRNYARHMRYPVRSASASFESIAIKL